MYEDKCSVTYETAYEEQCRTESEQVKMVKDNISKSRDLRIIEPDMRKLNVNPQVCKTVYDTITEQKCEISYETVYDEVANV